MEDAGAERLFEARVFKDLCFATKIAAERAKQK
jgi:hypothetical protein